MRASISDIVNETNLEIAKGDNIELMHLTFFYFVKKSILKDREQKKVNTKQLLIHYAIYRASPP